MKHIRHRYREGLAAGLPFLSSLLLFLAFLNYHLSWLALVGLMPYLFYLQFELQKKRPRIMLATWLMGLFFMLFTVGWLIATDTQGWIQINGALLQIIIFALWVTLGVSLSVGFLAFGRIVGYFSKRLSFFQLTVFVIPTAWALNEFIRSFLVSLIVYGRGGTIGADWNFGVLGLASTATPLGYVSRWVGMYGMSMLAVAVNVALFWLAQKRYRFGVAALGIIMLLAIGSRYVLAPQPIKKTRVTTVQLASADNDYFDALAHVLKQKPLADVLVLPEYSYFFEYGTRAQQQAVTAAAFGDRAGTVVYTRKGPLKQGFPTNEIVIADQSGHIFSAQEKSFLIPTGEYLPWSVSNSLRLFHQSKVIQYFNSGIAVAKSPVTERPVIAQGQTLGVLACSGVISPSLYRHMTDGGANVLINSASLNQFRNAKWYHQQARQFARFQAIANDRPFIQSARGGYSFVLNENGDFLVDFPKQGLQAGTTEIDLVRGRTLYTIVGEWTLVVSAIGLAAAAIRLKR